MSLHDIFVDEQQLARCRTLRRMRAKYSPVFGVRATPSSRASTCQACGVTYPGKGPCPMCEPRAVLGGQ